MNTNLSPLPVDNGITKILPAIRVLLTEGSPKTAIIRHHALVKQFYENEKSFLKLASSNAIYIEYTSNAERAIEEFKQKLSGYKTMYGYSPKIIVIKDFGIVAVDDNYALAETALNAFDDLMQSSSLSENREVKKMGNKVTSIPDHTGRVANKIVVVTGGAQGFGAGIAEFLMAENANVVIADLNEAQGAKMVTELNAKAKNNRAVFVKTDVSNAESVQNLVAETVKAFGGLDVFISNAGILRAGGLDEMTPETFELMTRVNYSAYFLCAKYASEVMKLQSNHKAGYFSDIIQINSKSGLKGSNKNFAYAGGKFGGIGLTQSFALELMPFKIKVNSICPGNFFDGPLWSDPENGLFVQYLKAGKVPGAKTIADVKAFYEKQVPAGRGCEVKDVMRAIYYIIEQEYETGQAVPVTGGQEMLK